MGNKKTKKETAPMFQTLLIEEINNFDGDKISFIDSIIKTLENKRYQGNADITESERKSIIKFLKERANRLQKDKKENVKINLAWTKICNDIEDECDLEDPSTEIELISRLIKDFEVNKTKYNFSKKVNEAMVIKLKDRLAKRVFETIEDTVEKKYEAKKGKKESKSSCYQSVKNWILGKNKKGELNINFHGVPSDSILAMLDEKIKKEREEERKNKKVLKKERIKKGKDDEYFEQVQKFTQGFTFLAEDPFVVRGRLGASAVRLTKSQYERYCNLTQQLQNGNGYNENYEYYKIIKLLNNKSKELNSADRRILEGRYAVMSRRREEQEGIR